MDTRIDARKKEFKKSFEDPRRKREDEQLQIRKVAREAHLAKKRQQATETYSQVHGAQREPQVRAEDLPHLVEALYSQNEEKVFEAAKAVRKLLSVENSPPIQQVVDSGIIPLFVHFLSLDSKPLLQFEVAWALTNIASGNQAQTKAVLDAGAVDAFVRLLKSSAHEVREQAVWALGNIAGDGPEFRNRVLAAGALPLLLKDLSEADLPHTKANIVRYATWTLSNLCRGKPEPPLQQIAPALPVLRKLLYATESEILTDACWAVSYLSDSTDSNDPSRIDEIIHSGVCGRLVELLGHSSFVVQTPAIRAVGNIVTGNDQQTQTMLSYNLLPRLKALLDSPKKAIKKEACWTISNITAGNRDQIEEVIVAGIIPDLVRLLETAEFEVKREAAWAISNAASGGNLRQVEALVEANCIKPLVQLIDVKEARIVTIALEAIENILKTGKQRQEAEGLPCNPYTEWLEAAGGFSRLEKLQYTNEKSKIHQIALSIMSKYLDTDTIAGDDFGPGFDAGP